MQKPILFLLLFLSFSLFALGQNSDKEKLDSARIAGHIEKFAKKHRISRFIYNTVFKPVAPVTISKSNMKHFIKIHDNNFNSYEGKVIRNIIINPVDPFGYKLEDTIPSQISWLNKTGNALHKTTIKSTVKNLLMIKKYDIFDSLLVKESERLIRAQSFAYDISFTQKLVGKGYDSVDIYIRVLDVWTILPKLSLAKNEMYVDVNDRNFLGLGHQIDNTHTWTAPNTNDFNEANYFIPNIYTTYINATLDYKQDAYKNTNRSISINRPFYSAYTKYAGGAAITQYWHRDSFYFDSVQVLPKFNYITQDYWAGKSFKFIKGNSYAARTANIVLTSRFVNTHYITNPTELSDPTHIYTNENLYMISIGISQRKYVDDKYIFKFGITENVPVGKMIALVAAYDFKHYVGRYYIGMKASYGKYSTLGYISPVLEYGNFFGENKLQEGIIKVGASYFSNRFSIGKWKIRQFIKPQFTFGINRPINDNVNLNNNLGIKVFGGYGITGKDKIVITLQTQIYAPWNVLGFKIGPFITYSFGLLGNAANAYKNSYAYSQFGIGVLIKNEYLVLNAFQVSLAFYPYIPGSGTNLFKVNPYKTSDFGFHDFDISAPSIISYQ